MRVLLSLILLVAPLAMQADTPRVATDILPVHALTARVMQGVGSPALIVPPNASPHGHALRPSEARALDQADLVIWMGEDLTPWLTAPRSSLAADASTLELLQTDGTIRHAFRETVTIEPHDHAHDHSDDHGHSHDHDTLDPHAWLDPQNAVHWTRLIAERLSALDPQNAATYAANADAARDEISNARAEIAALLEPAKSIRYVVLHDAYQYFETHFGLAPVGAIKLADATDPSPSRIAALRAAVTENAVTCALAEPQFNTKIIDTVLEGTNAKTVTVDPLGTTVDQGSDFYPKLLTSMAKAIISCAD